MSKKNAKNRFRNLLLSLLPKTQTNHYHWSEATVQIRGKTLLSRCSQDKLPITVLASALPSARVWHFIFQTLISGSKGFIKLRKTSWPLKSHSSESVHTRISISLTIWLKDSSSKILRCKSYKPWKTINIENLLRSSKEFHLISPNFWLLLNLKS